MINLYIRIYLSFSNSFPMKIVRVLSRLPCAIQYILVFFFFLFNWSTLDYNVVLVSGVQQSEPIIRIHIPTLFLDPISMYAIREYWVEFPVLYIQWVLISYLFYI